MNDQNITVERVNDPLHPTLQGDLFLPTHPNGWGVLVLNGSSGRLDEHTARLFAGAGAVAFAQRWFGQPGLPAEIRDVPLELFREGVDLLLSKGCSRIALTGRSRGAEAALLAATNDERAKLVVAVSPSSVAWAGTGTDGRPSWTLGGRAIPFVSYDLSWWNEPHQGLVEYREYHERSLRMNPQLYRASAHRGGAHGSRTHTRGRCGGCVVAVRHDGPFDCAASSQPWASLYSFDTSRCRPSHSASGRNDATFATARTWRFRSGRRRTGQGRMGCDRRIHE